MLHMTSARCVARDLHLSVRVGDSSGYSEEIVKNLELCLGMRLLLLFLYSSGKASASVAAGLGSTLAFLCGTFSGWTHASDLKTSTLLATLPGIWCYWVSVETGWCGVKILWLSEIASLICNFSLSHTRILAQPHTHTESLCLSHSLSNTHTLSLCASLFTSVFLRVCQEAWTIETPLYTNSGDTPMTCKGWFGLSLHSDCEFKTDIHDWMQKEKNCALQELNSTSCHVHTYKCT